MSTSFKLAVACLVVAALASAGCSNKFPKCGKVKCGPCLECDQLLGSYQGTMSNFKNDCLGDLQPPDMTQPWDLYVTEILYDEATDTSYLEFDYTELGYGVVSGSLCAPREKKGEQLYAFCMDFPFDSMIGDQEDWQTTIGDFIEGADGAIRFEGQIHNLMHDPVNEECHIKATISATQVPIE